MHDAARHVQGLRLGLSQDKAPLALLLGAGCPVAVRDGGEPLIPDIRGMTAKLTRDLNEGDHAGAFAKLLKCLSEDGNADPNLEDWLSHVRALAQVAGGGAVRGLTGDELNALETSITDGIVEMAGRDLPDAPTAFHSVAAWAGAIERDKPVELFTTNYDLLFEQAFESQRGPFFDGFVGAREPFFDNASVSSLSDTPLPARFTRLWKLHGAVNWFLREPDGAVIRCQNTSGRRRLIHPSHLKYEESRQMPYLALQDRLRACLAQRGTLIVACGYSFSDGHLNAVLQEGLQANPTASLVALAHSGLSDCGQARLLALAQSNFSLFARDGAVLGTREGPWRCEGDVQGVAQEGKECTVLLGDFGQFGALLQGLLERPTS